MTAETVLFYNLGDIITLRKFANESGQQEINLEKLQRMQEYAEAQVCRRRILLNYFGETSDRSCGNCDVCHTPPQTFEGTIIVQKALSAIMRTNEQIGFTVAIDILRGSMSPEVVSHGYNQLKTFAVGRDISHHDWHDYLLQMLQMGFIEIAYNEDRHIHVTEMGKEVLYRKRAVQLAVINREDFSVKARRKRQHEEFDNSNSTIRQDEDMELFNKLKEVRKRIADEHQWPAYVVLSDRSLYHLAIEKPTTLAAFGNTFGIGEHKRDTFGTQFIEVIKKYAPAQEELPFPEATCKTPVTDKPVSYMEQQKQLHTKAYTPWTKEDEQLLTSFFRQGLSTKEIAERMNRNRGGISSRIKKLGLERPESNLSDTARKTFELLSVGLNPQQVAEKRKLTETTIYDHITDLIENNLLNISDFVSIAEYDIIAKAIRTVQSGKMSEIKILCGDEISYAKMKMVLADLRRKKEDTNQSLKSIPYTLSSKQFLSYNCRVVLSESGYFLECNGVFTKLCDTTEGFCPDEGSIYVKKPKDERGYRIYHDTDDDICKIGYIREEKDKIIFNSSDGKTIIVKVG